MPALKLVAIVGPTAVGKTSTAIQIADVIASEVISADSRQVYRWMDIGTAKPTPAEQARLKHHLVDIVAPDQTLSLAEYLRAARQTIVDINARGLLPLLVGGTGQYVRALLEGWTVPEVPPDEALRSKLYSEAERLGTEALHARLAGVDPQAALRIDPRNVRRVVRALEVYYTLGRPISEVQAKTDTLYQVIQIGLTLPREELYQRADARLERMLAEGFVDEVSELMRRGYSLDLPAMSGLGYQQIGMYLKGQIALDEALALIRRHTRRFIRHQYNWFRLDDPQIHWYHAGDCDPIIEKIAAFIGTRC